MTDKERAQAVFALEPLAKRWKDFAKKHGDIINDEDWHEDDIDEVFEEEYSMDPVPASWFREAFEAWQLLRGNGPLKRR